MTALSGRLRRLEDRSRLSDRRSVWGRGPHHPGDWRERLLASVVDDRQRAVLAAAPPWVVIRHLLNVEPEPTTD